MLQLGKSSNRDVGRWYARRANLEALAALALLVLAVWAAGFASAGPSTTQTVYAPGKIVPIPASVPHEPGDMVDRRIVPDLRWIAARFPIYVVDGYSGPLPGGGHAGCDNCHVENSDHYNGLAVDVVPLNGSAKCDASWRQITRLALWAEPQQNEPLPPFRWVGYNGDAGHGCGNHLHLSWNHAPAKQFQLAEWVEVFPVDPAAEEPEASGKPRRSKRKPVKPPPAAGPAGGISVFQSGGVSPQGD
ncbi:MAG TPA: hypothetical protein VG518_09555 [Solirubrobacterales bacterium]|nr:hypothetical protein [Solirubrobacterales bacterium]